MCYINDKMVKIKKLLMLNFAYMTTKSVNGYEIVLQYSLISTVLAKYFLL